MTPSTPSAPRTRLDPEQRRAQLLETGAELFAELPYDEVHIEAVADRAGVSRGLLYHYFPTKRAFFAELVRHGIEQMAQGTEPDPSVAPAERVVTAVEFWLDHVRGRQHTARAVFSGAVSGDAEVRDLLAAATDLFERRLVAALFEERDVTEVPLTARVVVRSWLGLLIAAGQELAERPAADLDESVAVCLGALAGMLDALPAPPPAAAELAARLRRR